MHACVKGGYETNEALESHWYARTAELPYFINCNAHFPQHFIIRELQVTLTSQALEALLCSLVIVELWRPPGKTHPAEWRHQCHLSPLLRLSPGPHTHARWALYHRATSLSGGLWPSRHCASCYVTSLPWPVWLQWSKMKSHQDLKTLRYSPLPVLRAYQLAQLPEPSGFMSSYLSWVRVKIKNENDIVDIFEKCIYLNSQN